VTALAQMPLFGARANKAPCRFYLGTHRPDWLSKIGVPLFVSRRRLCEYKRLPRARGTWALDSGGFTELNKYGTWTINAAEYVAEVRRFRAEMGGMEWAAIQDWMCEPFVLQKTGLSIEEHQRRTTANAVELLDRAPEIPWAPVIQGWDVADYLRHADAYEAAGIDLRARPIVGVGSVCRRQHSAQAESIFRVLAERGLALHGFGLKQRGLARSASYLSSADSLAWSFNARRNPDPGGCPHSRRGAKNCANCAPYALAWRSRLIETTPGVA
jgi:hypothetical protein